MEIRTVGSKKDFKRFVRLPWQIYKNDPCWVPPLISEQEFILDIKRNPFWKLAEQKLFIAMKGRKIVGRIAGIIDRHHIEFHHEKVGFFGFFEAIDDYEVAELLLSRVREWLREKGMRAMRGPLNPSQNEECGLLIDGFNSSPVFMMTYNPKYYIGFMEKFGLKKAKDLLAYYSPILPEVPELLKHAAEFARKKHPDAKVRPVNLKDMDREKEKVKYIYNHAWENNWGFVPMTEDEFETLVKRLLPIIDPKFALFVEIGDRPVGFLLGIPDLNEALKHINGSLFPFGWIKLLYYLKQIKTGRALIMGVLREFRMNGLEAMLYLECNRNAYNAGYRAFESSWILEDNLPTRRAIENFGGSVYKTYRLYQMAI